MAKELAFILVFFLSSLPPAAPSPQALEEWSFEEFSRQLDLSQVLNRTQEEQGWDADFASDVQEGYLRFLYLVRKYDVVGVPSPSIDHLWHSHILDTRKYFKDTKRLFNRYLHHAPSYSLEDKLALEPDAAAFEELFFKEFMIMDPKVWPRAASSGCGSCNAASTGGCGSCKTELGLTTAGCGSCKSVAES